MRVFVFHPVLVYIFNYCNIIIKKKKKIYIYIYTHTNKQRSHVFYAKIQHSWLTGESEPLILTLSSSLWLRVTTKTCPTQCCTKASATEHFSTFTDPTLIIWSQCTLHTHTYIYIYIYMWYPITLYLVVVWFILVSLGSFCCNLVYNWILFILLKIKNWK